MKYLINWGVLLLWIALSFKGEGCELQGECDARCYGYRRAWLHNPNISVDGKYYSWGEYFSTQAKEAQELRNHLIASGAFTSGSSDSKDSFRYDLLPFILLAEKSEDLKDYKACQKFQKENVELFRPLKNQVIRAYIPEYFEGNNYESIKRDALTLLQRQQEIDIDIDAFCTELLQKDSAKQSKKKTKINGLKKAITAKENEIPQKILEVTKRIKEEMSKKSRNIASFGFVFFNEEGILLNTDPFHFGHRSEYEELEKPFFFLSGRKHRNYFPNDPHPWTALPEKAPKSGDLKPQPSDIVSFSTPFALKKCFEGVFDSKNIERLRDQAELSYNNYKEALTEGLIIKALQEPFFQYVYNRHQQLPNTMCRTLGQTLSLPVMSLQGDSLNKGQPVDYPRESADGENAEGDFTHSEQYAFFQAAYELPTFLERCVQKILSSQQNQQLPSSSSISSYAVLIYSYNVMCIRCAQSAIIDFTHTPRTREINQTLDTYNPQNSLTNRKLVFMAGYTIPYASELHDNPLDNFESKVRDKIPLRKNDRTLGERGKGYDFCSPADAVPCSQTDISQMVYHYMTPLAPPA